MYDVFWYNFQTCVSAAIGHCHFPPVDNTLNPNTLTAGMNEMIDKIVIINAVDTDFNRTKTLWVLLFQINDFVYMVMNEAFRMIRVILLTFGEFWYEMHKGIHETLREFPFWKAYTDHEHEPGAYRAYRWTLSTDRIIHKTIRLMAHNEIRQILSLLSGGGHT